MGSFIPWYFYLKLQIGRMKKNLGIFLHMNMCMSENLILFVSGC